MTAVALAPPRLLSGFADEATRRQFAEWFEWLERLRQFLGGGGLIPPVFLTGAANDVKVEHLGKYLVVTNGTATTLTLRSGVLSALPLGACIYMVQAGAGQLTLAATGVTVRTAETLKTRKQWSSMMFVKTAATEAILNGDLELA